MTAGEINKALKEHGRAQASGIKLKRESANGTRNGAGNGSGRRLMGSRRKGLNADCCS
jgi:hypothetical protein